MNLNLGLNRPINKEKNLIKKEIINSNFKKIISLILTNRPIVLTNLNYPNKLANKMNTTKKGYSLKNNNLKNYKTSYIKENGKFFNVELSKINKDKKVIESSKNIYNKRKKYKKNKSSFYILNNRKYNDNKFNDIPITNTSFQKKKKIQINKQKSNSILNTKNTNSFSKSQNINNSNASFDIKKISERKLSPIGGSKNKKIGINFTIKSTNKNNKFYLIKNRQNICNDLKTKMSLYIQNQKKYSQREKENRDNLYSDLIKNNITNINKNIGNISFSYDKLKKIKKVKNNNTFTNITTNISDKDNISSRKNNIATNNSNNLNSNNIHYFTTNFNSSTNITETNNDLYNEIKYPKEKKCTKKKIKLPMHPKSKGGEMPERKKFLIRDNKSEIKIPFNKKNKISKVKSENSFHGFQILNFKNKKIEKLNIHNTSREKKNNSSFIDSYINQNFINSSGPLHYRNKISISKNNLSISSRDHNFNIGINEGIEMNHFRIVSIIQENKRLLRQNDNDNLK